MPLSSPSVGNDPLDRVSAYVARFGIAARPLREAIAALTERPWTLDGLVATFALSRRTVEGLLDAAGGDLERGPSGMSIRAGRVPAYRERFRAAELQRTRLPDPLAQRLAGSPELLATTRRLAAAAPAPVRSLDHVAATPETVARRALWLDAHFDLTGGRLLCIGDHDLSGLAACAVNPGLAVTVVDVDERILAFIDEQAGERGWGVRCLYADVRHGLPAPAQGWADAVLADPPYTPEGVQLFAARGLQGLRDRRHGRLVIAYGFGEGHPALGLKVQRAVQRLHVTFETIIPAFNRYDGAQAIGSASDLYVARPTARTWQQLDRLVGTAQANLYTRGPRAVDATATALDPEVAAAVRAQASGPAGLRVSALIGDAWPEDREVTRMGLARVLTRGLPAPRGLPSAVVAGDLSADPGSWLLRTLLAVNADRIALLVPNDHPDLASGDARQRLAGLVRAKYRLYPRRGTPDRRHAVVLAERVALDRLAPSERLVRWILERAHGKVGNTWREGLIALSGESGTARYHTPLTKRAARAAIEGVAADGPDLEARLVEMPRHRITELVERVELSAGELSSTDQL